MFAKAETLLDKSSFYAHIKLPNSQTLVLLPEFAQQLGHKNADVPDVYFPLLGAAGIFRTLVRNQNATVKMKGRWVSSKRWMQNLQKFYTQGGAAFGSVRILVKSSNLRVSKVRQFFPSRPSYTNFTLATLKLKKMKAFARFKNENWCKDLAYVYKPAK